MPDTLVYGKKHFNLHQIPLVISDKRFRLQILEFALIQQEKTF